MEIKDQTTYRDTKEIFDKIKASAAKKNSTFQAELRVIIRKGLTI